MKEHVKSLSAIFPIKINASQKQVLIAQRMNTGYKDGMWDVAGSGHVDETKYLASESYSESFEH